MNKDLPKISIVTPSFNQAEFLEATIQSILSQNYPNLEYIIIDGGSTDNSVSIIKKYEQHLHFWCSEPDEGHYYAVNKGFSKSTGEIMAWLNSDDMYCPWALKTVGSIFSEFPQVEWLTTLDHGHWDWYGLCSDFTKYPGYSREAFLDGCYLRRGNTLDRNKFIGSIGSIQQESTFWRRSLWNKVGGYVSTKFDLASDFDLWSRFYMHTELYGTNSPLGGFRRRIDQRSGQRDKYRQEMEQSLKTMRDSLNWTFNTSRKAIFNLKLHQVPYIKKTLSPLYSYTGKKIARCNPGSPKANWKIQEYSFFVK